LEDFNQYNVRRFQEKERNHFTFESTNFLHPIVSHLPFVKLAFPVISNYNGILSLMV
jgi:hypothetical protein